MPFPTSEFQISAKYSCRCQISNVIDLRIKLTRVIFPFSDTCFCLIDNDIDSDEFLASKQTETQLWDHLIAQCISFLHCNKTPKSWHRLHRYTGYCARRHNIGDATYVTFSDQVDRSGVKSVRLPLNAISRALKLNLRDFGPCSTLELARLISHLAFSPSYSLRWVVQISSWLSESHVYCVFFED